MKKDIYYISELVNDASKRIVGSQEEWKKYLTAASKLYKYPFQEQLLIYAQRPNATACASIEDWNSAMKCWVNKGAEGIALIDDEVTPTKLKYVFDISDVHKLRGIGHYPFLWDLKEEHKELILSRFKSFFDSDITNKNSNFEDQLIKLSNSIANNHSIELTTDLKYITNDSFLEELDEYNINKILRDTLSSSVSYSILSRCGANMEEYETEFHFEHIYYFNTTETLSLLGTATSELCKPILMEIGKVIKTYERQKFQKRFDSDPKIRYNTLKRESDSEKEQAKERGFEHEENRISRKRGLSDSQYTDGHLTSETNHKVRIDEERLSEGKQAGNIQQPASFREIGQPSTGDTRSSGEKAGLNPETNAREGRDRRETERRESNPLDSKNEQHSEPGRGDSKDGNYLQLSLFPTVEEQIGNMAVDNTDITFVLPTAFLISDENVDLVILSGSGKNNSRFRIFSKYRKDLGSEKMTEFLKQEYETGGKGFEFNGEPVAVWFDREGIRFAHGNTARYSALRFLSWNEIEAHTRSLIENGNYMTGSEMLQAADIEKRELANKIYFFFRDEYNELPEELDLKHVVPESIEHLMVLLSAPEGIHQILDCMDPAIAELEKRKVKSMLIYNRKDIRTSVSEMLLPLKGFPEAEAVEIPREEFITQDEIDFVIGGSGYQSSKYYIYDFFYNIKSIKSDKWDEVVSFLKSMHGIGGRSNALPGMDKSWEQHDSKGIKLDKGNITNPYTSILLSWKKVAKRIHELIQLDRFFTLEEKTAYKEWKYQQDTLSKEEIQEKLAEKIEPKQEPEGQKVVEEKELVKLPGSVAKNPTINFNITNDNDGKVSHFAPKEQFRRNIDAIKTLRMTEHENRTATATEQNILSQYAGWGGLAQAFDEHNPSWANEYQELKTLLNDQEYESARSTVLNAHYTPVTVIQAMYETLSRMGFKRGNILEPALGTGKFFGVLPEDMGESNLYGVEIDGLTGLIAKQLYPNADIIISGFEKTNYPNEFFDVVIGNVPFGQYKVSDKAYDKHNFLIHDYFIAKSLDKVRSGGMIAVITSKGTMDKGNQSTRKYIAQRAELLGAVRLPNTTFKAMAGTEVTSDILFFQKRDRMIAIEPDWVHLNKNDEEIVLNQYFVDHPEMIVGEMKVVSGAFGEETTCMPRNESPFMEQLQQALSYIQGKIESIVFDNDHEIENEILPADPTVKNYSFTISNDMVYYRENSVMVRSDVSQSMEERIKGLIKIRNCTNDLIQYQLEEYGDYDIGRKQKDLEYLYDAFSKQFGLINSKTNKRAFSQDSSYYLLCSLEVLNNDGTLKRKADMFTRRTIKQQVKITNVDTSNEALIVSLNETAKVDIAYMKELTGKSEDEIISDLEGVIFLNPITEKWETADEYLSGNVREKRQVAILFADKESSYAINVNALEKVQPKPLDASEIEVRLGATWIDSNYINEFISEVFETPERYMERDLIGAQYSGYTGNWNIKGKNVDFGNVKTSVTYGTKRANAYRILEDSLNLRDTRIFDTIHEDGKEKRILNKQETMFASQKQEAIKAAFKNWIFKDMDRRNKLCGKYNEIFNSSRPREYTGNHLEFPGMSPDITLIAHQKNAVARMLYGNNTLAAHCVGAGYVK